ncbi:hypothetical protein R6Q59_008148 [Mikania micrantha]|uniref:Uncharacterized protein n=1 Tax=Mikania micrantha TaxID=192012 RepID=A0A5N6Q3P5_9ASTR|nr:hypothetical protein E3N88_02411 [Mikania micrantha]
METSLKRGSWSAEEDHKLITYINKYGIWNWSQMPKFAGLSRSGKSCRLRWMNYLKPNLKKGKFSKEEEESLLHYHSLLGNRWSAIALKFPGRTDNDIKNYWHTHLKKRMSEGIRVHQTTTDQNDAPAPLDQKLQPAHDHMNVSYSAGHDILSSHDIASTSSDHPAGVQFRADDNDDYTCSPGTIDDLQCFWDQLYPFENLEFGNNHNMDMFSDYVFQDSNNDLISSYTFFDNNCSWSLPSDP